MTTYNTTVTADSPTLYWPMDGITNGGSGSDTGWTASRSAAVAWTTGIGGVATGAPTFNNSSTYIFYQKTGTNTTIFNSGTWSIELWFKRANNTDVNAYRELLNCYDSSNRNQVAIYGNDNTGKVSFWYSFKGAARTKLDGPVISDTNWHHAVATSDGTTVRFYVDGVQVTSTGVASTGDMSTVQPIWLGAYGTGTNSENWDGAIDEVAVYTTALSLSRVQAHYIAGGGVVPNVTVTPPAMNMGPITNPVPPVAGLSTPYTATPPAATLSLSLSGAVGGLRYADIADADNYNTLYNSTVSIPALGVGMDAPLIKFEDISVPSGQYPTVAVMNVYGSSWQYISAPTVSVYRVTSNWSESSGTASNVSYDSSVVCSSQATAVSGTVSIDITPIAQAWARGAANYGVIVIHSSTSATIRSRESADSRVPTLAVAYGPGVAVNVAPPAMSIILGMATPPTTSLGYGVTNAVPASTMSVATAGVDFSVSTNLTVAVPASTMALDLRGGTSALPDYMAQPFPMTLGLYGPGSPSVFIAVPTLVSAPPMTLSLDTVPATIDLTTNVLKVAPIMGMSLAAVGIYDEAHDRYFNILPSTLDANDIWYKLDEASGATANDSSTGGLTGANNVQNGSYVNVTPILDGPQLRKGVHFTGTPDSWLKVGPYATSGNLDYSSDMAVTVEFSIRTTATDGVVFAGTGYTHQLQNADGPLITGNEVRLEAGNLVIATKDGKTKVRKFISDGQWHHIVIAMPSGDQFTAGDGYLTGAEPHYVMIDGDHVLVRYGSFVFNSVHSGGEEWLPLTVMARPTTLVGSDWRMNGFLAGDLSNFIVRIDNYIDATTAQSVYYEWSDANVIKPTPMTLALEAETPKVKGSVKKMLALYGLPWTLSYGSNGSTQTTMYNYMDVLTGMVIENLGGNVNLQSRLGGIRYWPAPQPFMIDDYFVIPVSIFGNLNNDDSSAQSISGTLNADAEQYGGAFINDETGGKRFINLQEDLSVDVVDEYDVITVVNYPWERVMDESAGAENYIVPFHGAGWDQGDWEQARDDFRDSLMEAVYDGANMWIGDYYAAMHLGFIQGYDIHDFGRWGGVATEPNAPGRSGQVPRLQIITGKYPTRQTDVSTPGNGSFEYNLAAQNLDNAHLPVGNKSNLVGSGKGDYFAYPQANFYRRITALVPDLTDLPGNDYAAWVEGWNVDEWIPNGNFVAWDILRRPNGLQLGDNVSMQNIWMGTKFFGQTSAVTSLSFPTARVAITSAQPDGICGTVVSREQEFYYGPNGTVFNNPYKDNALTIAAERGTIVRGRPIGGRVFIEMMGTDWGRGYIGEDTNKQRWHGSSPAEQGGAYSTWDYDSRREMELKNSITVQSMHMSDKEGAFSVQSKTTYFFSYSNELTTMNLHLPMTYRGLHWLSKAPELVPGEARVFASAMTVSLTTPNATLDKTSSPASQVLGAMRLDLQLRQPANYADGNVEERTLPMEMSLDMRGLGRVVSVPPMSLTVTTMSPSLKVAADTVTVFLDEGRNITLFLKEDN